MPFSISLRTRLLSLAALSLAPVALACIAMAWSLTAGLDKAAAERANLYAHAIAAHHEGLIDGTQHLLRAIAATPIPYDQPQHCDGILAEIVARSPQYRALAIADLAGQALCASPGLAARTVAAASAVAMLRAGFNIVALPDYGDQFATVALIPASDGERVVNQVVLAVIQPHWLDAVAGHVGLPPGATVHLLDAGNRVLSPEGERGMIIAPHIVATAGEGAAEGEGAKGPVTAGWPIEVGALRVVVTLPPHPPWWQLTTFPNNFSLDLVLALLGAMAIASLGIHRLVLVKMDKLGNAVRRIRAGELGVRSELAAEPGEFGRLARTFDSMAASLDDRALTWRDSLRASETRWCTLAQVAPVAIFRTDTSGDCHYVNDRWKEITGQPAAEALGSGHLDCLHPEDAPWVTAALLTAMAARRPIDLAYRCRRPDGRTAWVLTRAVPEPGPTGEALGYIGTMTDITGQRLANEALHHSEARFRHALKHSRVSVFAQDLGLTYTWAYNCPSPQGDLIGQCDEDVFAADEAARLMALKFAVLANGKPRHDEVVLTLSGQPRVFDLWLDPLIDRENRVIGIVGASIEITEERILQRELTKARETAEQANHAKSRFLASASHDLRQPFQAMRLFSAALTPYLDNAAAQNIAAKLDEAMTAGELLLKALLDVSTLEAGIVTPRPMAVAAADMVERLAREFQPQAEAKELSLRWRAVGGLVWTDPVLLERMLRNLLHNAVRYTTQGGIVLAARRRGDGMAFEVWDTGLGIAAAEQTKVFEDFYQIGNPERDRSRGLGLGLSVVARTARLLGHALDLRSTLGRGSVFTVTVRLAEPQEQAAA
jgi:PAS domain S-box-containing protein